MTRKAGRPTGSRNKLSAKDEINKALSKGKGLIELKEYLWGMMNKPDMEDLQRKGFAAMYLDIMKYIHTENLKLEEYEEDLPKGSKKDPSKEITPDNVTKIKPISFGKKVN